ncbi:MAG: hypothetical protein QF441_13020 [Bacteriovoracaceae bacterium]|jgi:hypothetical protein|nr:hypothetical protein [Halobacteriovoraceae bacterium]MDP7321526.1 hypothetical protein [Bacteriovoracaceae bacterium]
MLKLFSHLKKTSVNSFLVISILLQQTSLSFAQTSSADLKPKEVEIYQTANSQLYEAQRLLTGKDDGEEAYELLRDLLKNDETINEISREKIQKATNMIDKYSIGRFFSRMAGHLNFTRFEERPYIKAKYLLAEAIMDSRVALNESSDSEILFVEKLLKNYFYPGHADKVTIHYPSIPEFAFETWALTNENIIAEKVGASTEVVENADMPLNGKNGKGYNEITEEEWIELVTIVGEQVLNWAMLRDEYSDVKKRVVNRYLYQSMLMQAIAEPGSVLLDPQLQAFVKQVKIEIDLGETQDISPQEQAAYLSSFGEDIFKADDLGVSFDLTKLFGLERKGTISNLELNLKKSKSDPARTSLSIVSSVSGEDLMFLRYLQVATVGIKEAPVLLKTKAAQKTIHVLDKIFDTIATWSMAVSGPKATSPGVFNGIVHGIRVAGGWIVKIPKTAYDTIGKVANSKAGQAIGKTIKENPYLQNGSLMKGLVVLSAIAEITTAAIEYQYTETKREKLDLISETGARLAATGTYLIPIVGQVAAIVDFTDLIIDTGVETADIYRGVGKIAAYGTLAYYGYTPTTIELAQLENAYGIPRHNVKLALHGAWIEDLEDAQKRQIELFKEMENITLNNLIVLYRAHRTLDRGANTDFGEKIYEYSQQYDSNLEMMKKTEQTIQKEIIKFENQTHENEL